MIYISIESFSGTYPKDISYPASVRGKKWRTLLNFHESIENETKNDEINLFLQKVELKMKTIQNTAVQSIFKKADHSLSSIGSNIICA